MRKNVRIIRCRSDLRQMTERTETKMKIVVLCGGLSTERKISFRQEPRSAERSGPGASGSPCGYVPWPGGARRGCSRTSGAAFDSLPELKPVVFDGIAPDLCAVRASRKWKDPSIIGLGVLDICKKADMVLWLCTGSTARTAGFRRLLISLEFPIPARTIWERQWRWIRSRPKDS